MDLRYGYVAQVLWYRNNLPVNSTVPGRFERSVYHEFPASEPFELGVFVEKDIRFEDKEVL
jgi:hypothetical protein